jgi:hypothetical protein
MFIMKIKYIINIRYVLIPNKIKQKYYLLFISKLINELVLVSSISSISKLVNKRINNKM